MSLASEQITAAAHALHKSVRLVVLSGAGFSRESGIPTYRDALEGIWAQYDPMKLATPRGFRANPKLVWDWYEYRRALMAGARPNAGHSALVELEDLLPQVAIVTQNIDGLHHIAGSSDIIELHGNIHRNQCFDHCQGDPTAIDVSAIPYDADAGPPRCPHCGAWVRPAVVWFEESLPAHALQRAIDLSENADVMLVAGTSGVVHPAASLPFLAHKAGATVIEVNPEVTPISSIARWHLAGPSGVILPQVVAAVRTLNTNGNGPHDKDTAGN